MTKQILAFLFCFIRELNIYTPLISILPPTYPPIPPPIHDCAYGALISFDCAYGAFYYLGSECDHLPEAGNTYIGIHPSTPYLRLSIRERRLESSTL